MYHVTNSVQIPQNFRPLVPTKTHFWDQNTCKNTWPVHVTIIKLMGFYKCIRYVTTTSVQTPHAIGIHKKPLLGHIYDFPLKMASQIIS